MSYSESSSSSACYHRLFESLSTQFFQNPRTPALCFRQARHGDAFVTLLHHETSRIETVLSALLFMRVECKDIIHAEYASLFLIQFVHLLELSSLNLESDLGLHMTLPYPVLEGRVADHSIKNERTPTLLLEQCSTALKF